MVYSINSRFYDVTFKYWLRPVWTLVYRYGKKYYQVLVNAQTGEVEGRRPYSVIKITLFSLLMLGVIVVS